MVPNATRARDYMAKQGVRALLASSTTNVAYLTGFDCWLYQKYTENVLVLGAPRARKEVFAILGEKGNPVLVADSYTSLFASETEDIDLQCYGEQPRRFMGGSGLRHVSFFKAAVSRQKASPLEALVTALGRLGVNSGRVAIERGSMRPETLKALQRALPRVEFLEGSMLFSLIRMVKTDAEVALLRKAALVNERSLYRSLAAAKVGIAMDELVRKFMVEIAKDGAVFDHYFYSPDGLWLSSAPGYPLRKGEHTIIDSGCTYNLYFGDMGTTIVMGNDRVVTRRYDQLWETITEVADSVQPGDRPSDVMKRFGSLYAKQGISDPDYQGHGIGLEPREYPIMGQGKPVTVEDEVVTTDTEIPLEPGMVISLETSLYEFGKGSYEVERTFVIKKGSLEELTTKKDRHVFVGGA